MNLKELLQTLNAEQVEAFVKSSNSELNVSDVKHLPNYPNNEFVTYSFNCFVDGMFHEHYVNIASELTVTGDFAVVITN
jgi:hypothetical protein